ncbi:MAG: SpoIID/LytB domain-containing protein [Thermoanaerobacteraceae bacterium]|nr:SpoIID/LytB domain-containing protein [Thermoanaerobacteraceae bacterium]
MKKTLLFVISILLIVSIGCTPAVRRLKQVEKPPIPERISRGENKEPTLKVYIKQTGKIEEMPLENYVMGTVAGEIKNDWPMEALKAQAILARTYVLDFVNTKKSKYEGADTSTDFEEAQAWNEANINDRIKKAVNDTRGQVAVYNGNYIKAWFFSHAGGMTATAKEGLNFKGQNPPYIQVVKSPETPKAKPEDREWTAAFSKQEVLAALNKMGAGVKDFSDVKVASRGPSGRTTILSFSGVPVNAPDFRIAIGSERMKSTLLESLRFDGNTLTMRGKGFGHGVGMSQWGAYGLAEQGKTAEEIIKYYFKGVNIAKMWD